MNASLLGALLGLVLSVGILTVGSRIAATRRPPLLVRVAPYVPLPARTRADLAPGVSPWVVALGLVRPMRRATDLPARLRRAGLGDDLARYRLQQTAWVGIGLVGGTLLALLALARGTGPIALLLLPAFGGGLGLLLCDRWLSVSARRRSRRISEQLPNVADLLAFAVAAGESPLAALDRVSQLVAGELADEIGAAVREVRAGTSLEAALRQIAESSGSPEVERFVDGLIVAIERGTPLVDVLRAQAADARAGSRRALMEIAGRKDVLMLVPVVFLVLPTVVLVAVYPGFATLELFVS